ncbi:MAG: homocysteine S-methyltransferase family protein [Polyangiaceae bacterium]
MAEIELLDGAMGTELERMGASIEGPAWSTRAIVERPELVRELSVAYARAGATVLTANTFRLTRPALEAWRAIDRSAPDPDAHAELAARAIELARAARAVSPRVRVAASVGPTADCWEPWRTPPTARALQREKIEAFARAEPDVLLCETFADPGEAIVVVEEALATRLPVWLSLTAGPDATLLTPEVMSEVALRAARLGVARVLVNCIEADQTIRFVRAIASSGVPVGAYGNAGLGPGTIDPARFAAIASQWIDAGATAIGGCCGTGPRHVAEMHRVVTSRENSAPLGESSNSAEDRG